MNITRRTKHVGAMIGSDGYLDRWTAPRNKFVKVCAMINEFSKRNSLVDRLVDNKINALTVLSFYCAARHSLLK